MADNVAERRHFQGAMWERNNWERNSKEVCKELNLLYRTAQLRGTAHHWAWHISCCNEMLEITRI